MHATPSICNKIAAGGVDLHPVMAGKKNGGAVVSVSHPEGC